ncbi:cell wall hydrolase [Gorillibacterium sp. CAU 1737]|uniref:cell wall hydrolase n=1 Tax=Gorillibacterium sp. CAU 1737 TaxID=3140362 RepID=UPI003260399F
MKSSHSLTYFIPFVLLLGLMPLLTEEAASKARRTESSADGASADSRVVSSVSTLVPASAVAAARRSIPYGPPLALLQEKPKHPAPKPAAKDPKVLKQAKAVIASADTEPPAKKATSSKAAFSLDADQTLEKDKPVIAVHEGEVDILARIIHAEARGESYEGQVAVGAVIVNRVESPSFPDTIREVILQRGAFTAVQDGQYELKPGKLAYQAAREALAGSDPTKEALYYYNPHTATSRWIRTRPATVQIGNHVFAR